MTETKVLADRVGDRYRLIEVIGAGGMGRVWLAEDELLWRKVAVKEIPDGTMAEARAAARLHHVNVVKIYDVVWWSGRSWIVMEHVESRSLHQAVRDDGPLPHREAALIGLQMLAALHAAHTAGVLHRDVKPHNVLLGPAGRVVLTDFGLAATDGTELTGEPLMGSPGFIAPERLSPGRSGPEADLWSLGATLYAATEGRSPFDRASLPEALIAAVRDEPDEPRRPGPLTPVILGLLAKDPAARPTPADLEERLRQVTETAVGVVRPTSSVVPAPRGGDGWRGRAAVTAPAVRAPEAAPPPWRSAWPAVLVLLGATLLLAGLTVAAIWS
ncbi:MAG: serine/threonine-protein kinase [Actinoplanes sp.]